MQDTNILEYKSPEWLLDYAKENMTMLELINAAYNNNRGFLLVPAVLKVHSAGGKEVLTLQIANDEIGEIEATDQIKELVKQGKYEATAAKTIGSEDLSVLLVASTEDEEDELHEKMTDEIILEMFKRLEIDSIKKLEKLVEEAVEVYDAWCDFHNLFPLK